MMDLKLQNAGEVERFLEAQGRKFKRVPEQAVKKATALALRNIKNDAKSKGLRKTGTYVRSMSMEVKDQGRGGWAGRVGTWINYALGLEKGTKPHVITPRRRRALRFVVGGREVFARRVNHPGTRAYHVFRDGLANSTKGIINIFEAETAKAGKK